MSDFSTPREAEAESVDKMICYEIALQPRPQDDTDFYLFAVHIRRRALPLSV
jgi:hypothetical protein